MNKLILAVKDTDKFTSGPVSLSGFARYLDPIFGGRSWLEKTEKFKQIIPYVVLQFGDDILIYDRSPKAGEARLHGKTAIGFGGHTEISDFSEDFWSTIETAAIRELEEETQVSLEPYELTILGTIFDRSSAVSRMHLGIACLAKIDLALTELVFSDEITNARLVNRHKISLEENLEPWAKIFAEHWL